MDRDGKHRDGLATPLAGSLFLAVVLWRAAGLPWWGFVPALAGALTLFGIAVGLNRRRRRRRAQTLLTDVVTGKYRVGQLWRFQARPGEEEATLTVCKVERDVKRGIVIVHVSLRGVRVQDAVLPGGFALGVPHLPFSESALDNSVTTLLAESGSEPLPDFKMGYFFWLDSLDRGKGNVFNISVAKTLAYAERALAGLR